MVGGRGFESRQGLEPMLSAELSTTEQCIAEGYTFQLPPFAGRQESPIGAD
jgi:hypothetical protein